MNNRTSRERYAGLELAGSKIAGYGAAILFVSAIGWGQGELVDQQYGSDKAKVYAEQNGYTDVQVTDTDTLLVSFRGCDEKDATKYELTATAPNGAEDIGIIVCKGLFKGATVRQD